MQPLSARPFLPHDWLLRAARRHPFFLAALAIHGVGWWAVSQWHGQGLEQTRWRIEQSQIEAHTQAAVQHGLRRRVDRLQALESLAERIERTRAEPSADPADANADAASSPAPAAGPPASPARTPQDMLAQARALRDSIQRIEQAAQARKMAEVLKLSLEQALQKVQQQAAAAARQEAADDAGAAQSPEQLAQALDRYEQQARAALQRLQAQAAQEQHGTATQGKARVGAAAAHAGGSDEAGGGGAGAGAGGGLGGVAQDAAMARADGRPSSVQGGALRSYGTEQRAPAFDPGQLRLGAGNSLGAGGVWANRVYVDRWYLIGPFHAPRANGLNTVYPPEQWVDLDGVYLGKGKRAVRWQYISSAAYPLVPPDYAEQAIYYGYTEIVSDRERSVWMALGADDDAKLWVNEQLLWTSGDQRKAWYTNGGVQSLRSDIQAFNLIEERRRVPLRKGRNTVLFKLYNSPLDVFFSLVIEPAQEDR